VVVWVKLPEFPTTVTTAGLVGVLAAKVNTLVVVLLLGLKFAVTPVGTPDTEKLTTPLNPFNGVTVMVLVSLSLGVVVTFAGAAESEKSALVPQLGNLKVAIRVFQLKIPVVFMYSLVYQKVQSSLGSTCMAL
jgi:hypothetical protein